MLAELYDYFLIAIVKMYLTKCSFVVEIPQIIPKNLTRPVDANNFFEITSQHYDPENLDPYIVNAAAVQ